MAKKSQLDYIIEYFKKNPNRDIEHPEVVDSVTKKCNRVTAKIFRDPNRAIRKLHQSGFLIKVKKGVYKYDPNFIQERNLEDFTEAQKKKSFSKEIILDV